jgi:WD40 repeat protein
LLAVVEEEVARLPVPDRSAILLCWFEDGSLDDAARRLGLSKDVLWGRLKRGRERLRRRLTARGFGPPAVLAAACLTGAPAAAGALVRRTTEAALRSPAPAAVGLLAWLAVAAAVAAGAVTLLVAAGPDPPPAPPKADPPPAEAAVHDGFPLPPGAVRRFGNRQMRHPTEITAVAVSPDGKLLATGSHESIVVWDLKTLTARRSFPCGLGFGSTLLRGGGLAFLPDNRSLLVSPRQTDTGIIASDARVELAQVWDVETGRKKFGLTAQQDYGAACWPAAGGTEFVVYSGGGGFRSFAAADGKELRTVPAPLVRDPPWIGPGGSVILVQGRDGDNGAVLDVATGKEVFGLPKPAVQAAFGRDGNLLVWVDRAGTVHVHDLGANKEKFTFTHPEKSRPGPMVLSADSRTLYFTSDHGRLFRWDLASNKKGPDFGDRHNSWSLTGLALSPDESVLYSVSLDHLVKRWDTKTGKELPLPEGYATRTSIVVAADGKHLIVADHEGRIDYWDLATGHRVKQLGKFHLSGINQLAQSADGKWLAGGRTGRDICLIDLTNEKIVGDVSLDGRSDSRWPDRVQRVTFASDGKVVYSMSGQSGLTAWEVPGGKMLWNAAGTGASLAVDPKGRWLAVSRPYRNSPVHWDLLDAKSGSLIARMDIEEINVLFEGQLHRAAPMTIDLAWRPDGSLLYSIHYDGTVRVWDPKTRKEVRQLRVGRLGGMTGGLACSADGRWLAAADSDRTMTVWDLTTWAKVHELTGHDSPILQLAFTKDGRGLVSNADLSPILWDLCPKDLPKDGHWQALASDDGAEAYRAQWALIKDPPAAVKLLGEQVKPAELGVRRKQFDQWVADLDSPQFKVREAAEKELTAAGYKVSVGWLRTAVEQAKSDESRARLGRILAGREKPDPKEWRLQRAVQVLELAGTPEAVALLKTWATADGSPVAEDARGALGRKR